MLSKYQLNYTLPKEYFYLLLQISTALPLIHPPIYHFISVSLSCPLSKHSILTLLKTRWQLSPQLVQFLFSPLFFPLQCNDYVGPLEDCSTKLKVGRGQFIAQEREQSAGTVAPQSLFWALTAALSRLTPWSAVWTSRDQRGGLFQSPRAHLVYRCQVC